MRKIILFLLSIFICSSAFGAYTAIKYSTTELEAANSLATRGIINNHKDDSVNYKLGDFVLRQEIAAVSRGVAGLPKKTGCDGIFSDVTATKPNTWACLSIEVLVDKGLITKNKEFRPEHNITKAETLGMLIRSIGFDYSYDPKNTKSWQEQIVDYAFAKGVIKEKFSDYDTFATRGWVFMIADTTIKKDEEIKIQEKIDKGIYSDITL
ncbi:MAG: S-layer homology domain-containing protein [Candidatus Gracilibacteria bacterium]|nr:S-layer homology domain-containing protein [Candidatus Gracilibacteria bacterium]